jgi:hypothetical protein
VGGGISSLISETSFVTFMKVKNDVSGVSEIHEDA